MYQVLLKLSSANRNLFSQMVDCYKTLQVHSRSVLKTEAIYTIFKIIQSTLIFVYEDTGYLHFKAKNNQVSPFSQFFPFFCFVLA